VIEIGLYRERAAKAASPHTLRVLAALCQPVAAAFRRHGALTDMPAATRARTIPAEIVALLTPREQEVAELLLRGCSSDAVASRLSISRHTVKDHRKHIFARLGISSLAELFALAG
jgi:DNA-binding CsgD family transcriptional regulator